MVVREAETEILTVAQVTGRLYADSSQVGGALSAQRITLGQGASGASPHHHTRASELFYVLQGAAEILTGDRVLTAEQGDLVVVPPRAVHAFAAAPGTEADLLVVVTPGIERFEYFRQLQRVAKGEAALESILDTQDLYDNHFDENQVWQQHLLRRARPFPVSVSSRGAGEGPGRMSRA
ncbi:cupin domain-containing protein [Microbispora sp. H10836]|uniref:cupin domain-containing protein n=1 Tax=Microbispora sp. H10836 TaxID=2729106 RepID=UPI002893681C|nr:cupin domain-containing protein [Microbispora sp. H10836]